MVNRALAPWRWIPWMCRWGVLARQHSFPPSLSLPPSPSARPCAHAPMRPCALARLASAIISAHLLLRPSAVFLFCVAVAAAGHPVQVWSPREQHSFVSQPLSASVSQRPPMCLRTCSPARLRVLRLASLGSVLISVSILFVSCAQFHVQNDCGSRHWPRPWWLPRTPRMWRWLPQPTPHATFAGAAPRHRRGPHHVTRASQFAPPLRRARYSPATAPVCAGR